MSIWHIERIDVTEGSHSAVVHWRLYDDNHVHSIPGTASITLPADMTTATEASIAELVRRSLNETPDQFDEHGNLVPPDPKARKRTDDIEAALAEQVAQATSPKATSIKLPWTV